MQHYYDALFEYISLIIDIPEHDRAGCRNTFKPLWVARDTMLEVAGKVPVHHNFIVSGFMRKFYINDKGEEVTVDLNNGPRFFTSYFPFVNQSISNEYLQCILIVSCSGSPRPMLTVLQKPALHKKTTPSGYSSKYWKKIKNG